MISTSAVFEKLAAGNSLVRQWRVPADLPYFEGHFPGNPIFPAVGIVDASIEVLTQVLGQRSLHVTALTSAKFTNPIVPGEEVTVTVRQLNANEWSVEWTGDSAQKTFASLRIQAQT